MNPFYQMMVRQQMPQMPQIQPQSGMVFQNPIQKANYILNTLTNPSAFVREQFPDVPSDIANDPNRVLQYIQQTRNISNEQLNQIMNRFPRW